MERYAPGEFCWIELATSNQDAAKNFYGALFGWTARDVPTGPGQVYSLLELQGRIAAAAFTISPGENAAGVPPHWHLYVAVSSADEAAKKAGELGGKVVEGPFDVMDRGRAALIFSASSPGPIGNSRSSSSRGMATFRCRCRR